MPGLTDHVANIDSVTAYTASLGGANASTCSQSPTTRNPTVADNPTPTREQIEDARERFAAVGLNVV